MHLAGQSDARDLAARQPRLLDGLLDGLATSCPPMVGILLGPAFLWSGQGVRAMGPSDYVAVGLVDDQGPGTAGAQIDAQYECRFGHGVFRLPNV